MSAGPGTLRKGPRSMEELRKNEPISHDQDNTVVLVLSGSDQIAAVCWQEMPRPRAGIAPAGESRERPLAVG